MLPQVKPGQAQIQVGNCYVSTNLSRKSVVLTFQWLKLVQDTEKRRGIILSTSIMGKGKKSRLYFNKLYLKLVHYQKKDFCVRMIKQDIFKFQQQNRAPF